MSYIYFIKPVGKDGAVKIGNSKLPQLRLRNLLTWSPLPLEIVCYTEGASDQERALHAIFKQWHSHGEWFHANPRLAQLMADISDGKSLAESIDLSEADGIARAPNVMRCLTKQSVTLRVTHAETHAYGWSNYMGPKERPAHINTLLREWRDSLDVSLLPDHQTTLLAYVEALRALPKWPRHSESLAA